MFVENGQVEANEEWILELPWSFSEAMEQYVHCSSAKAAREMAAKQEIDRQELAKLDFSKTRCLAACTQAVIILRSTSCIAIELKCSAFEVVRNSIESICLSYSALDCISWNRLIAYYSFTDLKHVKWVKIVISAYEHFSLYSSAFAVVCLFFHFSNKRGILNFRVMVVRDIELPWALWICSK